MNSTHWRWDNVPVPEAHVAALGVACLAQVVLPVRVPVGRRPARLLGWPMIVAGVGLAAWGVTSASGAGVGVDRPARLVTTGAFAFNRNPMYVGWSMGVAGLGMAARSPWVLGAALVAARHTHREILQEEATMARAFGPEFEAYAAATPRYLSLAGTLARLSSVIRGTR